MMFPTKGRLKVALLVVGVLVVSLVIFQPTHGQSGDTVVETKRGSYNTTTSKTVQEGPTTHYTCSVCGQSTSHSTYRTYYFYWRVTYYAKRYEKRGWVTVWQINTLLDSWEGGLSGGGSPCGCYLVNGGG